MTSGAGDFPSAEDVAVIADQPDPVLRNLWITWSYYRLNRAMTVVLGGRDLSWCGFATWASKTAGTFIREEEIHEQVEPLVGLVEKRAGSLVVWLARLLGIHRAQPTASDTSGAAREAGPWFTLRGFVRQVMADVASDIARGNQEVFRNIAPPFAKLLTLWTSREGALTETDRMDFLASLRGTDLGGEDYLPRAFEAMFAAAASADERIRAQAVLTANVLIGCAEQKRVQPYVERSMNQPVVDLWVDGLKAHLRGRFFRGLADRLAALLHPIGRVLEEEVRQVSTRLMMELRLPGGALHLGEGVPPLPDGRSYPVDLDPLDRPQPVGLFEELGVPQAQGSAAKDWADFSQRMRYIAVLFRSRQQERAEFSAPYSDQQVETLKEGRVPSGPL